MASVRRWAALLFVSLFVVYHANWSVLDEGDAVPTTVLPAALLGGRGFTFDPDRFPELFNWRTHAPLVERTTYGVTTWQDTFGSRTALDFRRSGHIELNGPRYYVVESPTRHVFVSVFGPLPGLVLLPFAAPFHAVDPHYYQDPALRSSIAKLASASLVAGVATLIFLLAARRTTPRRALLAAVTYGLGTCAWAVSSQNLWQQTVNQAFLALGAFFLFGNVQRPAIAAAAGLCFGLSTACRPTGALALACVGVHLLVQNRRSAVAFALGALPPLLAIGAYNLAYFGSPFVFAQELVGHVIAEEKTGSPELWQTPLLVGAAGLLASPSRGLLVFSPVLAPAAWGAVRAFRREEWRPLRPLLVFAAAVMAVQCKWFDWWGGHAYGYRPWLDELPILALALVAVLDDLVETRVRRVAFGAALAWSIAVQVVGACAYDRTWHSRELHIVDPPDGSKSIAFLEERDARRVAADTGGRYVGSASCDIDLPYCRFRLWSVTDNMLAFHVRWFLLTRGGREPPGFALLGADHAKQN